MEQQNAGGETRAGDVLQRMRQDIVNCVLKPGEKLRFESLRERYEVSFSTLREALSRLAAENLAAAAATMAASPGAMQLRSLQTIDGLGPTASNTVVLAVPIEVMEAVDAVAKFRRGELPLKTSDPSTSPTDAGG